MLESRQEPKSKRGTRVASSGLRGTILRCVPHDLAEGPQEEGVPIAHGSDLFNKS